MNVWNMNQSFNEYVRLRERERDVIDDDDTIRLDTDQHATLWNDVLIGMKSNVALQHDWIFFSHFSSLYLTLAVDNTNTF